MRIPSAVVIGSFLFQPLLATAALQVSFQKVYDSPGAGMGVPFCEGGPVYFELVDASGHGLAAQPGGFFVHWNDTIDGSQANQFFIGSVHNGVVGVGGFDNCCSGGPNAFQNALYLFSGSTGHRIVDVSTPVPGYSSQNIIAGARPSSDGTAMVFKLGNVSPAAIAWWQGGSISVLVTNGTGPGSGTPMPSSADNFFSFSHPSMSANGQVIFTGYGWTGRYGVYLWSAGQLSKVVDSSDTKPDTGAPFGAGFLDGTIVRDGNDTAFSHSGSDLYKIVNGQIALVANRFSTMPGLTNKFTGILYPSLQSGKVVFQGSSALEVGIYTDYSGSLEKIVDLHTTLDGKTIKQFFVSQGYAFAGNKVYFTVLFTDNSYAVYSATLSSGDSGVNLAAQRNGANIAIQFPTVTGYTYDLQHSVTLASNSWQIVLTNIVGTGANTNLNLPLATNLEFFRLQIHAP